MSRIHEALKRAEQERAASQATRDAQSHPEPVSVGTMIQTAPPAEPPAPVILQPSVRPAPMEEPVVKAPKTVDPWSMCPRPSWKPEGNLLVFGESNPSHAGAEQFRTLRSRLYRMRDSQPLQTIVVSSAITGEGKTLISINLAYALARQQGCRVLLVDADLRSPRIHTVLGAPSTPGFADFLQGTHSEFEVIQQGPGCLFFSPAGNHATHPSELISSDRTKQFLARVKPAFDWIIIDSPPSLPVSDSSVLGALCDGVLFVVRAGSTPSEVAQKAVKELRGTHILGVILNSVEITSAYGSYYSNQPYGAPSLREK